MEPSGFRISQITPAGYSPARRARSMLASVWPTRCSTPPGRARSGNTCPGRRRSEGTLAGSTATRMVAARSAAEMPVVTPNRVAASIDTVKAVSCASVRSEEHTSELQSPCNLVCRLLLEKKKKKKYIEHQAHYPSHKE